MEAHRLKEKKAKKQNISRSTYDDAVGSVNCESEIRPVHGRQGSKVFGVEYLDRII